MKQYYVYIVSSFTRAIYIGVTSDLQRRVYEHKQKVQAGFTCDYNINRLVYFETYASVTDALAREKQLKRWRRSKKDSLILAANPNWEEIVFS